MEHMSVQVRLAQLRSTPSFLGQVVADLAYGARVLRVRSEGDWLQVRSDSQYGWVHQSALTPKEIILNPSAQDVERAANSTEIALAGKGFNAEVEKQYRQRHQQADFAWVDRAETLQSTTAQLARFVTQGSLNKV